MRNSTMAYIGRTASQLLFLGLTAWIGYRMIRGVYGATIEKYCPFGGVETLIPWLGKTGTICSLSTMNISILAAVLIMTVLFKRVFCSHICPVGAVSEWIAVVRRHLPFKTGRVPRRYHRALTWLKYPLLVAIIFFTVRTQELIFRELDPYYVLFSLGSAHGIADGPIGVGTISLWIIAGLLLLGFAVPLLFCKYLCPLAACLTPLSRLGLARVSRNEGTCTGCGECDAACEWGVSVSDVTTVSSGECSNCQDCIRACSEPGTLTLRLGGSKS
jgi:polyferredoxin